jgi:hypothetical protein
VATELHRHSNRLSNPLAVRASATNAYKGRITRFWHAAPQGVGNKCGAPENGAPVAGGNAFAMMCGGGTTYVYNLPTETYVGRIEKQSLEAMTIGSNGTLYGVLGLYTGSTWTIVSYPAPYSTPVTIAQLRVRAGESIRAILVQ